MTGSTRPDRPARPTVALDHHSEAFAADPHAVLDDLRSRCPVAWSESYGGFWALTRYGDVQRVLGDAAGFSSRHDLSEGSPFGGVTIPAPPMRFIPVELDPPEFLAYRRLLNPIFSPPAVEALRPRMVAYTDWCIDRIAARGEMDLVADLTSPVPAMVTLELLGLPVDDWPRCATTFHDLAAYPPGSPPWARAVENAGGITAELRTTLSERRARPDRPRRGAVDALLDARVDGVAVPDERLVDMLRLILAGGIDTTTGAATGALVHLGQHPAAVEQLTANPTLLGPASEEFVRWVSPTPLLARTATCPSDLDDQRIDTHERIMANLYAANHDPGTFPDPEQVVLDRRPNRHLAFGAGIHRCVGAHLARAELEVIIARVLARLPDLRVVADDVARYPTAGVQNGYLSARATFAPTRSLGTDPGFC